MSEPYLAQITMLGSDFPPKGYAQCNGQLIAISSNNALFSLLGTTFGGDGRTTFGLPDMRGRVPVHMGTGAGLPPYNWGQTGGQEEVVLSEAEMASHNHTVYGLNVEGESALPKVNRYLAQPAAPLYAAPATNVALFAGSITSTGGNQAHSNMQPFATLNFCIATTGYYPSRS